MNDNDNDGFIKYEDEDYAFSFELLNSVDEKIVTLVSSSQQTWTPEVYAQALISFAERIMLLKHMSEAITDTMN